MNNNPKEIKLERHGYVPMILAYNYFASISLFSAPHVFTQILCGNHPIFKERLGKMTSSIDSKKEVLYEPEHDIKFSISSIMHDPCCKVEEGGDN